MLAAPDSGRQSAVRRHGWHSRHPQVVFPVPPLRLVTASRMVRSTYYKWGADMQLSACMVMQLYAFAYINIRQ